MKVTRLQQLYARAVAQPRPEGEACVSPEDLLALVRREGPEAHRLQVLDHVMSCQECHREFELLRALEAAGAGPTHRTSVASITRRLNPWALAASLLLVAGIGLMLRDRTHREDMIRGSQGVVLLAPTPEVSAGQPITFAWRSVGGAQRYRLEILDANGTTVFSQLTADTTVIISGDQLQPGSDYRWWVRDASPGAQLASALRPLRLRSR